MLRPITRSAVLALSIASGFVGGALLPSAAFACKCRVLTPQEARDGAHAVFEARVTKIADEAATENGPPPGKLVTVAVVRTWKGLENEEVVTVRTSESSASCGVTFELNASYLVYAGGTDDALTANSCGGTRPLRDASDDLAVLGAGNTPVKVTPADASVAATAGDDAGSQGDAGPDGKPPQARQGGCGTSSTSAGSSAALWWFGVPAVGVALRRRKKSAS